MSPTDRYDSIIIGGGHNGLVAAAYLARSGKRVCVVERRHVLGGASCTEELWPGFKVSTAAYVISLFQLQIIEDLRLDDYGLRILPRDPSSFTPLPDGRSLLLGPHRDANRREIGKFSQSDAEAFDRYERKLERIADVVEPLLSEPAPDPLPLPDSWRKIGFGKRARDLRSMWRLFSSLGQLEADLPEAVEFLNGAARPILERWFETEGLKAALATDAIIGAFISPSMQGSAYVLLHHVMGEAGGARGVWGYVQGGMGGLASSLEGACLDLGVEIRREAEVEQILTSQGRAVGVGLKSGEQLDARSVASSVDPHLTFERFLQPGDLPEEFRAALRRIDYSSASAKINVALSEPPQFTCETPPTGDRGVGPHHHGTIHVSPTLDYIERAYDAAKYGYPSPEPVLEITLPTSVDHTIAPEGTHLMSMFVQYAPYRLAEGTWEEQREAFGDRCIAKLAEYAPNVPDAVLHRQVLTPVDIERTYGLTGGNIFQGAMTPSQLFFMRPVPGWADHRTPLERLYLCGAASHPGGGVMGTCGRNAAREILRDL